MADQTIIRSEDTGTGLTPATFLAEQSARDGYRRLSLVTGIMLGAVLVVLATWAVERVAGLGRSPGELIGIFAMLAFLAVVLVGTRRGYFPLRAFVPIALLTEIFIAASLSIPIFGWQHRMDPGMIAWLESGANPPLDIGAGMVPWAGIWIVFFATLIPLPPSRHLVGATLSAATLLVWPFVSVAALGFPEELAPQQFGFTAHVAVWLFFRGAVAAGMAFFAARCVYGLRRQLARAEQMGSYLLREKLGAGGMGEVWKADHHMLARSAAIKLIKPAGESADGATPWPELTERFQREVQATARLRSPHTVEVYDYGLTDDGTFYYVMELLDGLDLERLVRQHGPMPWPRAVPILRQCCHSLGEAHESGLIHRDIKPANIFLCRVGRDVDQVKVLDFGLVKTRRAAEGIGDGEGETGLTQRDTFLGTPAYTAPEIVTVGAEGATPRSDLYSLGCVAYWLLAGRTVFQAKTAFDMLIQHAREEPASLSAAAGLEVPAELERVVLGCLAKRPEERPKSVDALAGLLRAIPGTSDWSEEKARAWWAEVHPAASKTHGASSPSSSGNSGWKIGAS